MPKWEYLEVKLGTFGFNNENLAAQYMNNMGLHDWKRVPLYEFINRLGADGWEMSGTIGMTYGGHSSLFFKRLKP